MKVLFSNPPWWSQEPDGLRIGIRAGSRWPFTRHTCHEPDNFKFGGYLPVPFWLNAAAAYAAREIPNATVEVRDSIARGESYESFFNHLAGASCPDWLIIETATPCLEHDLRIIEVLKLKHPNMEIILAGTVVADCKFKLPDGVTAAVKGEFEKGVVSVIRDGARGVVEFMFLTATEMNALPYPMFDEACATHYADGCPKGQQAPQLQVFSSRGCVFKCSFCIWPAAVTSNDPDGTKTRKVKLHTQEWMRGMLKDRLDCAKAAGTPYRCIYDDSDFFNQGDRHTKAMADVYAETGLPWSAMCRADTIAPETWEYMRSKGCFGVKIGFESGVQRVVDEIINKHLDLQKAADTARKIRGGGMSVHGTFTIGMPGETLEEQQATVRFIEELYRTGALDTHQLSGTAVIEGTPLATLLGNGEDLAKYPGMHATPEFKRESDGQRKVEAMRATA